MLKVTRLANPFRRATKDHRRTYLTILAVLLVLATALVTFADTHKRVIHAASGDWSMFQGDNARSGYNGLENTITAATASNLHLQWVHKSGGNIVTQPIVVGGQVFWGSWDGNEYASDLNGNVLWSAPVGGQTLDCANPPIYGASSTATVNTITYNGNPTLAVFVEGRDPNLNASAFYALDAATGATLWETPLSSSTASFSWGSPAFYNGSIYIGIASVDDCPLVRGALLQLDATTGAIQNAFYTVPDGCIGASIWSSPTIDESAGIVYVTTGNSGYKGSCTTKEIYGQAIVALNASDLSVISYWQIPLAQRINDGDFGATPTLFTATISGVTHQMVGAVNKSGIYYAFDRNNLSAGPLWTATVGGGNRNISPSVWDGSTLYVASQVTTISGLSCKGALRALDPATGSFIWETCLNDGSLFPAVMAVPGVAFVGEGKHIVGISTANGHILFNYTTTDLIKGAASVSNGVLYVGNNSGLPLLFLVVYSPNSYSNPGKYPGTGHIPASESVSVGNFFEWAAVGRGC
jgi:outer membrane protein assembly factor BamB